MGCPECRGRMATRTRREHNRIPGVCRYDDAEPEQDWKCTGCSRVPSRPRGHNKPSENLRECRWASTTSRHVASRQREAHPREAPPKLSQDPTAVVPQPQLNPSTNAPSPEDGPTEDSPDHDLEASSSNTRCKPRGPGTYPRQRQAQPKIPPHRKRGEEKK